MAATAVGDFRGQPSISVEFLPTSADAEGARCCRPPYCRWSCSSELVGGSPVGPGRVWAAAGRDRSERVWGTAGGWDGARRTRGRPRPRARAVLCGAGRRVRIVRPALALGGGHGSAARRMRDRAGLTALTVPTPRSVVVRQQASHVLTARSPRQAVGHRSSFRCRFANSASSSPVAHSIGRDMTARVCLRLSGGRDEGGTRLQDVHNLPRHAGPCPVMPSPFRSVRISCRSLPAGAAPCRDFCAHNELTARGDHAFLAGGTAHLVIGNARV